VRADQLRRHHFNLQLPDKKFQINIDSWQLDQTQASAVTSHDCSTGPTCESLVAAANPQVCTMGCSASCNARHTCDVTLNVSLAQPVDLVKERPELKSVNDQPVIKVSVDSVTYDVATNSLNVDTPTITVFVAPSSVTSVEGLDDAAQVIGTIDPIPAGTTLTAQPIKFTSAGKLALANIMSTFKTPFNVLIGSQIVITAGQPVPKGKLDAVVHITAHAGI